MSTDDLEDGDSCEGSSDNDDPEAEKSKEM